MSLANWGGPQDRPSPSSQGGRASNEGDWPSVDGGSRRGPPGWLRGSDALPTQGDIQPPRPARTRGPRAPFTGAMSADWRSNPQLPSPAEIVAAEATAATEDDGRPFTDGGLRWPDPNRVPAGTSAPAPSVGNTVVNVEVNVTCVCVHADCCPVHSTPAIEAGRQVDMGRWHRPRWVVRLLLMWRWLWTAV